MKKLFILLMLNVFLSLNVFSWDDTGHKLTTYIAWQQMSPEAREKAFKILMAAPEDADLNVYYLQNSRSEAVKKLELFMIASTWADIVRDREFKVRYQKYHKGSWHYLDTFWQEKGEQFEILSEFKSAEQNAVERLFTFTNLLKDKQKSDEEKSIALAWFLHLGGDIHQPLHCSARVTETETKGDQGGNLFLLTPKDTPREKSENLHWYWDSIITKTVPRTKDACDIDYIPLLAKEIVKKFPRQKMNSRLKLGKFDEWQKEGFLLATKDVYKNGLKRFEMPSAKYQKQAFQISQEQIALSGYRMGTMLDEMLKP